MLNALLALLLAGQISYAADASPDACRDAYAALKARLARKVGDRTVYRPLLSDDVDFLRKEVILAEGPAPQRNMRIVPGSEQFRINHEAKALFEQKKALMARNGDLIVGVLHGQEQFVKDAAQEQFKFILDEFPKKSPDIYKREGDHLVNLLTGDRLSAAELSRLSAKKMLEELGKFVPDDLIFMRKFGDEWRLVGGNLAFPTNWDIKSFLGETITQIHQNLSGTPVSVAAFSKMINGVLDRTVGTRDVVCRNNWFLQTDPRYAMPGYGTVAYAGPETITRQNYDKAVFLRTERQSLRGLPESKAVVFAIRPYVFPIMKIKEDRVIAENLVNGIRVKLMPEETAGSVADKTMRYLAADLEVNPNLFETTVATLDKVNDSTYKLSLAKPPGFRAEPGEAVRVTLNTPNGPATRTLSLASSPNSPSVEFAVRDSDSEFKAAFRALKPNEPVKIELLRTSLEFRPDKPAVMIAGGIGITPFRSFIQHVKDKNLDTPMYLLYGNRDQIAFKEELETAADVNARLQIDNILSRPGPEWTGTRGRIDRDYLLRTVPNMPRDAHYYIVAAPEMADDVQKALREAGVPDSQIHVEAFPGYGGKGGGNAAIDPVKAEACQTVCFCRRVSAGALREAIQSGASTLDQVKAQTGAATACGGCATNVMGFLGCSMQNR